MKRRDFLKAAGAAAVTGFSISKAGAQAATWPNKPVKLILPYAPGGATDLIGRPWADKLSAAFGQPFPDLGHRRFAEAVHDIHDLAFPSSERSGGS